MESGGHGYPSTCLSSEHHSPDSRSYLVHYFGCTEFCQREDYFGILKPEEREQVKTELRRVKFLRKALEADLDEAHLIAQCRNYLAKWKVEAKAGIDKMREWRALKEKGKGNPHYDPNGPNDPNATGEARVLEKTYPDYDPDMDINARVIMFKNSDKADSPTSAVKGKFPNQKIQISKLLDPETSPLPKSKHESGMVRYFHLPTNNMKWAEEAIHRYFEETPSHNPSAKRLLRPQLWKGQQRGGGPGSFHPRHLRPMCEAVSIGPQKHKGTPKANEGTPKENKEAPKSIVLFMPYLHWEMDRRRQNFAAVIEKQADWYQKQKAADEENKRSLRRERRGSLKLPNQEFVAAMKDRFWKHGPEHSTPQVPARTVTAVVEKFGEQMEKKQNKFEGQSRKKRKDNANEPGTPLGRLLLSAAMLCEAMSNFKDKKLLEKYVHMDPPLHPRNTLDQVYYWALRSTNKRDRDQVVYRGTRAHPDRLHRYDREKKRWSCFDEASFSKCKDEDSHHKNLGRVCYHCTENARRLARVVMVDQLWMWVLDEHTIITCFPKRYGHNRQDETGIHKSIRKRLGCIDPEQIKSAFDVAHIIVEECCNMFFDRSKARYLQPQVMDIFSEAIEIVTHKQTVSFEHLWFWAEMMARASSKKLSIDLSVLHAPLININPEGLLQKEIKDVLDELGIMLFIMGKQKDVVMRFQKHMESVPRHEDQGHDSSPSSASTEGGFNVLASNSEDLLANIDSYLEELEGLRMRADATATSVEHLLGLKQQQAGVVQAWQSIKHAEAAVTQGHAIVMFTILTVVFLPLAFVAAVFGMNNRDFQDDKMSFHHQVEMMIKVSVPIIVVVMIIAFSELVRTVIWSLAALSYTWLVVTTRLYRLWLKLRHDWSSGNIVRRTEEKMQKWKGSVRLTRKDKGVEAKVAEAFQGDKTAVRRSTSQSKSSTTELESVVVEGQSSTIQQRRERRTATSRAAAGQR